MGFHLNNSMKDQGLVRVTGGDRSCSQPILFVGVTSGRFKGPLVYIMAIRVLEIVQYSFVNPHWK